MYYVVVLYYNKRQNNQQKKSEVQFLLFSLVSKRQETIPFIVCLYVQSKHNNEKILREFKY